MRFLRTTFFVTVLFIANRVSAQTVDEVIDKHIAAIGGKEVINKIKTQVTEATLSVMGSELTTEATLQVGVGYKNVANFNGQEIIQVITPASGWMINPLQGINDAQALPEDQVKAAQPALSVGSDMFEYQSKGHKAELLGKEKSDGVDAYKIRITKQNGSIVNFFIDTKDHYMIRREIINKIDGQDVTAVSQFSDFRKTDIGYVMPFTTITEQGFEMTLTVSKVQFNVTVDPKIFAMPK